MNFTDARKKQNKVQSLGDLKRSGKVTSGYDVTKVVGGPKFFDCLQRPWLRGDLTGVLSPTGVGKTSWTLFTIMEILKNNQHADGVCVVFALEQKVSELSEKWEAMTADFPLLADRLYIYSNYDEDMAENFTITDIKHKLFSVRETLGVPVLAFVIDHLHLLNNQGSDDFNKICVEIKGIAQKIDAHGFIISQTQKVNQVIDVPVPRTGCYNCSQFEWIMTNIISLFQPLKRVENDAQLPLLGWQYSKIRYKGRSDNVRESMNYLLYFDHDTQKLRELNRDEKAKFGMFYEKVMELRQNEEKYKSFQFDLSEVVRGRDGKTVKLDRIVGGGKPESSDEI